MIDSWPWVGSEELVDPPFDDEANLVGYDQ